MLSQKEKYINLRVEISNLFAELNRAETGSKEELEIAARLKPKHAELIQMEGLGNGIEQLRKIG